MTRVSGRRAAQCGLPCSDARYAGCGQRGAWMGVRRYVKPWGGGGVRGSAAVATVVLAARLRKGAEEWPPHCSGGGLERCKVLNVESMDS